MKSRQTSIIRTSIIAHCLLAFALSTPGLAKGPTIDHLFPSGGQRGSKVVVTAAGQFDRWPVRTWTSSPGLTVTPEAEKGKLTVAIAADLPPGLYWIRLFDDEGSTSPRPFLVGTLPEVVETEPNDELAKAQNVDASGVIVNGRLGKSGDVDGFRVSLKKGQTLVAALEANNTLGSPMDAVLQVASPDGFVLAQNDDDAERDPRIDFTAPRDGDYIVRTFAFPFVQASTIQFAGNPNYVYRLTLTTRGFADHAWPLALSNRSTAETHAIGQNITRPTPLIVNDSSFDDESTTAWHPELPGPVEARRVDFASIIEVEPNDRTKPQPLEWPVALSGRIDPPGDVDVFSFKASKGEKLLLKIEARELGSPVDATLRLTGADGATLSEVDDARKAVDPEIRFSSPSDGIYRLVVRDLTGHGGQNFVYLLTIEPPPLDYRLSIKGDPIAITPGKPFDLTMTVDRREGYAEPIEIGLETHHDGLIAEPVVSRKSGPTAGSVVLQLKACDCLKPGPIRITGLSEQTRKRFAAVPVAGMNRSIDSAWITPTKPEAAKPEVKDAPKK